jgi:hypothetical protein
VTVCPAAWRRSSPEELTRACHEAWVLLRLLENYDLPRPRTNIDRHVAFSYGDVFEYAAQTAAELRARLSRA